MYQSTDFIKIKIPVSHMLFYWHKNITQKQQMGWIKKKEKAFHIAEQTTSVNHNRKELPESAQDGFGMQH